MEKGEKKSLIDSPIFIVEDSSFTLWSCLDSLPLFYFLFLKIKLKGKISSIHFTLKIRNKKVNPNKLLVYIDMKSKLNNFDLKISIKTNRTILSI